MNDRLPKNRALYYGGRWVESKAQKSIPVIALTGHASPENLARAAAAGADAVLTKPCTPDELLTVVKRLLGLPP